jgi:hypothetical protein
VVAALVVVVVIIIVASSGNGPKHKPSANTATTATPGTTATGKTPVTTVPTISNSKVLAAGKKALTVLRTYESSSRACPSNKQPTICLETADRVAGNAIHLYGNVLGALSENPTKAKSVTAALTSAQDLANSFEVLGDAEPTAANYTKVLGQFNVQAAVSTLQKQIATVDAAYGG